MCGFHKPYWVYHEIILKLLNKSWWNLGEAVELANPIDITWEISQTKVKLWKCSIFRWNYNNFQYIRGINLNIFTTFRFLFDYISPPLLPTIPRESRLDSRSWKNFLFFEKFHFFHPILFFSPYFLCILKDAGKEDEEEKLNSNWGMIKWMKECQHELYVEIEKEIPALKSVNVYKWNFFRLFFSVIIIFVAVVKSTHVRGWKAALFLEFFRNIF